MTTKEKIEIMQAYEDGKKIEGRSISCREWVECSSNTEPIWNWALYDYRIKPESTYRPYKDTEEMIADFKKRFNAKVPPYAMPIIWVKRKDGSNLAKLITGFRDKWVEIIIAVYDMHNLFVDYTYLDGSPCGMKETD